MAGPQFRDIIVIGASTGGVAALQQLLAALPASLPASIFVVLHRPGESGGYLAEALTKASVLPVGEAIHGERIEKGRVYLAPADSHLSLWEGQTMVMRGPRENGHRPAVNPLFRTAAQSFGARVIAVVLTGALDCGSSGVLAVKARGGIAIAQDPSTAVCGDMPASAIETGAIDHVVALDDLAPLLVRLVAAGDSFEEPAPSTSSATKEFSFVTCPLCHGSLTEESRSGVVEFACHVGHVFSLRSLYAEQADHVEAALWAAVRALEESTSIAQRLANKSAGSTQSRFHERERAMRQYCNTLREMLLGGSLMGRADVASGVKA
jgi:two-component system chemotaxis response regulator CheB